MIKGESGLGSPSRSRKNMCVCAHLRTSAAPSRSTVGHLSRRSKPREVVAAWRRLADRFEGRACVGDGGRVFATRIVRRPHWQIRDISGECV
jgi:hypothetical protein